jgi:ADP-heptose:LPS heptosyltransferase
LIQLGDHREPTLDGPISFAGKLTMRQSMAILSKMDVHIGPDSFLMHAANGLDVRSVVIFGGARPVACLGYAENENLETKIGCGPCWISTSHGESCPYSVKCMEMITPESVAAAAARILAEAAQPLSDWSDRRPSAFAKRMG